MKTIRPIPLETLPYSLEIVNNRDGPESQESDGTAAEAYAQPEEGINHPDHRSRKECGITFRSRDFPVDREVKNDRQEQENHLYLERFARITLHRFGKEQQNA